MEDYIVRIYRRKEENGGLFGVVEEVGAEGRKVFRNMGELVRLLMGEIFEDRRREDRIRLSIPATVEGNDSAGRPFSEETVIEDLSPRGAGFRLNAPVLEGDAVKIHIVPGCLDLIIRRARVASISREPDPRIVGVEFR